MAEDLQRPSKLIRELRTNCEAVIERKRPNSRREVPLHCCGSRQHTNCS